VKKYIVFNCISIIAIISAYWYPVELVATNTSMQKQVYSLGDTIPEEVIDSLIAKYASGTKAYQMKRTLYCESGYKNIQSNIVKNGVREDSWGIGQINLYWNNGISKKEALDPEFAIKWMSERWGKTKWYGYLIKEDKCNTIYQ
jgi:hypothetical protein